MVFLTLALRCQQFVQPDGRLLLHLHSLEKRSRVKKVLAGIVNDPQHVVAVRRGKHFIDCLLYTSPSPRD